MHDHRPTSGPKIWYMSYKKWNWDWLGNAHADAFLFCSETCMHVSFRWYSKKNVLILLSCICIIGIITEYLANLGIRCITYFHFPAQIFPINPRTQIPWSQWLSTSNLNPISYCLIADESQSQCMKSYLPNPSQNLTCWGPS